MQVHKAIPMEVTQDAIQPMVKFDGLMQNFGYRWFKFFNFVVLN